MSVRLNVLGSPSCFVDGRELVDLPAQKTRFALLVYLAIERNAARDTVAGFFWPDSDDERARHALSQALYELRRALGESWLEAQGGRLIVKDVEVDVDQFDSAVQTGNLEHAASLYRGEFLQGFGLPNNREFEDWVDGQRAQLERAHRKTRRELVDALLAAAQYPAAIEAARMWVQVNPLEDEANHRLIELLIRNGARADALNVFARYERLLKEELNVEPLDHTRQLIQQLRDGAVVANAPQPLPADMRGSAQADAMPTVFDQPQRRYGPLTGVGLVAVTIPILLLSGWLAFRLYQVRSEWSSADNLALDTTRFVIFPFERDPSAADALDEEMLLREAFARWSGVAVVDLFQADEAYDRLARRPTGARLTRLARELGAGRYIRGRVSRLRDSLIVHVVLYDVANRGRSLIDRTERIPTELSNAEAVFADIAETMLFRTGALVKARDLPATTRSWPARMAFGRGMDALREWDLQRADREFAAATQADSAYGEANLWLAQTRSWLRYDPAQWSFAAENAFTDRARLPARDRVLATALLAINRGDFGSACTQYRQLTMLAPRDFAAWYGLADCLQRDEMVVPDNSTSSGWRFRSSYHSSVFAYQRAFELLPSVHKALRTDNFRVVRRLLKTQRTALRSGSRTGSGAYEFLAYPELVGDTLVFIPHPVDRFNVKPRDVRAVTAAVHHQRQIFREVASSWLSAYATSPHALEAVSIALELLGDPSALDTLFNARRAARDEVDRVRLAASEVFLRLKYSLPHDLNGVRRARTLADSLLRTQTPKTTPHPTLLAALAVLTGRTDLALAYMRTSHAAESMSAPAVLRPALMPLLVFASLGGPRDSLAAYDEKLGKLIDAALPGEERERARYEWMLRASYMSLPEYEFKHLATVAQDDTLFAAATSPRSQGVRRTLGILAQRDSARRDIPPSQLTLDVLYPEAWLLFASKQYALSAKWLDPLLASMHAWPPLDRAGELMEVGAWVRAMALRAEVAQQLKDKRSARTWARPVVILWSDSDKSLRPTMRRMHELMN